MIILNGAAVKHLAEECAATGRDDIDAGGFDGNRRLFFNRAKVEEKHEVIKELLDQLPEAFHEGKGSGLAICKAYVNRDGQQWTYDQRNIERLFCLGAAAGYACSTLPRVFWADYLPEAIPVVMVRAERGEPGAIE